MEFGRVWIYDIEVFPNFFSITAKNKMTGKIVQLVLWEDDDGNNLYHIPKQRELQKIYTFFTSGSKTFVGYNNFKYDDVIIAFLLNLIEDNEVINCQILKEESDRIIRGQRLPFDHPDKVLIWELPYIKSFPNNNLDGLEILRKGYITSGSLKMVGIKLQHDKVQETFYDFNSNLYTTEEIENTLHYNLNDVEITEKLFDAILDRIELREDLVKDYEISQLLSASDSKIAKTLFRTWYCKRTGEKYQNIKDKKKEYQENLPDVIQVSDIVFDDIEFYTTEFQEVFNRLQNIKILWSDEAKKYEFEEKEIVWKMNGCVYSFGLGGIHSVDIDIPGIFFPNDDEYLLDADVSSQYPSVIRNRNICPSFLDTNHFIQMFSSLIDERLEAKYIAKKCKKQGDKTSLVFKKAKRKADSLKIAINTGYGTFNDPTWIFYDPYASYRVTLNCQLYLLMLIENLEMNDIKIISANTDGIIIRCKKDKFSVFQEIKEKWEHKLNFQLEETYYRKYVRKDVNDYIAQEINGDIKGKGRDFRTELDLTKGYSYPVIRQALNAYYIDGIDIMDFLKQKNNPKDIYDFCSAVKVSQSKWLGCVLEKVKVITNYYRKDGKTLLKNPKVKYILLDAYENQMINRWFISNPDENGIGYRIRQYKKLSDGEWQYNTFASDKVITLFNDYFYAEKYNIDYDFYYQRCKQVIDEIDPHVNPM